MPGVAVQLPPVLREGDRLTSEEFLRRWEAMPELKHAELIDGVVFMASPVSLPHGVFHVRLGGWLDLYRERTPGCEACSDATWIMGASDVPQPDLAIRVLPEHGGQSSEAGGYAEGAPELVVEISNSTMSRDLGTKLDLYRRSGVREYLTILLQPKQIIWRQLTRGRYREMHPGIDGFYRSQVFPGLWLDPAAVWDRTKSLRSALDLGLQSPEYAAFVKKLAAKRRS
jgi:Uma2 family endonuclease